MDRRIEFEDVVASIEAGARAKGALERLAVASDQTQRLTTLADRVLEHYVQSARIQGASWTQIGGALGTSKQAAQQRFTQPTDKTQTRPVYTALVTAEAEALSLGHNYIGTEHVLLALARTEDAGASHILADQGVTAEAIQQQTRAVIGTADCPSRAPLAWTSRARRVTKLAGKHARRMGCRRIQSGHLLLAIIDQRDSVATTILLDHLNVDENRIREAVVRSIPEGETISDLPKMPGCKQLARDT